MNKQLALAVLILTVGFSGIFLLSTYLERNRVRLPESYNDADLDLDAKKLAGFALGAEGLLADWYWMRSLQYVGDKVVRHGLENIKIDDMTSLNPRLLYPLLDNATTLDPRLMAAYSYGATVLPAIDAKQAIELTEKGIRNNPNEWRLYQYLGYIQWRMKDYQKAAQAYDRGGQIPGAPAFFKLMSAKIRSESGSRDTARAIYRQALSEATDKQTRLAAELRLQQLDAFDEMDLINKALRESSERTGSCSATWPEMVPQLQKEATASGRDLHIDAARNFVDPTGVPYRINRNKCEAEIDWPKSKIPVN